MVTRNDGRAPEMGRPVTIETDFVRTADGSCLICTGNTKVICTASVEENVPPFLRGKGQGWVTAEYAMLPASTGHRKQRDGVKRDGRGVEISRLIGRSLRQAVDLTALGERTITLDCDVLQADGGTRTAAITGAMVALVCAVSKLLDEGKLLRSPITHQIAAISVGVVDDTPCVDLCYEEDSRAQVDMNIVMNEKGEFVELQGTGEGRSFTQAELNALLDMGAKGIRALMEKQKDSLAESKRHLSAKPTLVVASSNQHKIRELQHIFGDYYTVVSMVAAGFNAPIEETATTFAGNAAIKAETVSAATGLPTLADDSGLSVEVLDGDPGVYSARYAMMAGEGSGDAANNALMKVDLNDPSSITAVIPENEKSLLENVTAAGGYFFASYLQDAQSKVVQYGFDGKPVRDIELPGICTAAGFDGDDEAAEIYYSVSGYTAPATIYKLDVASGESTLFKAPDVNFDPALFTTEQVFYTSKDGTKVPMFITHRKDLKLDGKNPCYLYAYGGFQINRTPGFRPSAIMFVEQGGVFCEANLRGGSEYGEAWHKAGMLENKQNVFDDFIAAAEYLIANKYTSKDKLAIAGGSNGGLLVGACEVQRPDLYAVCLPAVGVMDMLRYHKFTIGWGWAVEYGSSENEEQFDYIYKYSPLHNIREGVQYPATLVTTADHDDRVVPAHSFKFTAQIQHCQAGDAPILIRIESKAGHGAGKPTSKRIDEEADTYAFLFQNIGVPYKPVAK